MEKADIIAEICTHLEAGDDQAALTTLSRRYPHISIAPVTRRYTDADAVRVFLRDGFIDRYTGTRLVFPGTLKLLSRKLPDAFPAHPNWKLEKTHLAYWELFPTLDHVVPVARGGGDESENWVTTSMLRNAVKGHWTLDELGWELRPPGHLSDWDGTVGWFQRITASDPSLKQDVYVAKWARALERAQVLS